MQPLSPTPELSFLLETSARQLRQKAADLAGQSPFPSAALYPLLRRASSLEACARLLDPAPFSACTDLDGCARALADAVEAFCPLRPGQVSFFGAGTALPVAMPGQLLTTLLCHLACNSLQQTGRDARLCIKTGICGQRAYFYLADNGPGLPPAAWKNRGPGNSAAPGLGLFSCRMAARRLKGSFWYWNLPGKGMAGSGTAVLLAFPLQQHCPPFPPFSFPQDRFSPHLIQLSPCCILPD